MFSTRVKILQIVSISSIEVSFRTRMFRGRRAVLNFTSSEAIEEEEDEACR